MKADDESDKKTIKHGLEKWSLVKMDIKKNLDIYLYGNDASQGRRPATRYASYDYCYNYFQSFWDQGQLEKLCDPGHLQTSCLQLSFYLASWGMLRGSSFLLNKSIKFYEPVIQCIAFFEPRIWAIDVDRYSVTNIDLLLECKDTLAEALGRRNGPSDILLSKIMLGVFGNIPAFDTNFRNGLGIRSFGRWPLQRVADFYQEHRNAIDTYVVYTLNFETGNQTHRKYTKAKLIDMIGFIEGLK